jgi:LysM repeat protein
MRTRTPFRVLVAALLLVGLTVSAESLAGTVGAAARHHTGSSGSGSGGSSSGITTHTVRAGESVQSIAARHGITADDLRAANGIVNDRLFAGGRLVIQAGAAGGASSSSGSTATSSGSTGSTSGGGTYRVRAGDSLWDIAQRHGVSLRSLLSANGLTSTSLILPGRQLVIPGGSGTQSSSSGSSSSGSSSSGRSGSVLTSIQMVCPVPGASYMNDWGFPRSTTSSGFHQGNDLFAPIGTPVVAPISGQLTFGSNNLGGRTFHITSPSGWVVYGAHNSSLVGSDRWVDAGELVAHVGDSGDARGGQPHLHLGLRRTGGNFINPYPSLSAAC